MEREKSRYDQVKNVVFCCGLGNSRVRLMQKAKTKRAKVGFLYSATYTVNHGDQPSVTISEVTVDWQEPMVLQRKLWPSIARTNKQLDMQLANTTPFQSTTPGLYPVSIYQMAPPEQGSRHPITAYYSFIDLERMKG